MVEENKNILPLLKLSEVEEEEIKWLVPGIIPRNQVTLLAGNGGTGKTSIWTALAAAVSNGQKVFFDPTPPEFGENKQEKVLFFSSEDGISSVLVSRLKKANANLENIFSVSLENPAFSDIKFNSKLLEQIIEQVKPVLVVFDPLQSFVPETVNMSQRNAMRSVLNPLIGVASKYSCTFLIICHTNKRSGVAGRNRISDSADIWDIARSVLICGSTQNKEIKYISHEKCNYGRLQPTTLFSIDENGVPQEQGSTDKKDYDFVRELLQNSQAQPQREEATSFIINFLRSGKRKTCELDKAAEAAGLSKKTMERAKKTLKENGTLKIKSEGFGASKTYYSYLAITSENN